LTGFRDFSSNNFSMKNFAFLAFFFLLLIAACDTTGELPPNPFDPYKTDSIAGPDPVDVDPNSIVGLHYNIFVPTCANSGCHDGTFEPDFRSIESSYNTMVNHPIIKNDPQGTYEVRVMPGNVRPVGALESPHRRYRRTVGHHAPGDRSGFGLGEQ
jgi:hypothetical protein